MKKKKSLTNAYMSAMCMEFSMLLHAGVTLTDGVMLMIDDEPSKDGKLVLKPLFDTLDKGEPFSKAIRDSGYFPQYMINMIEIGETTGRLPETLKSLSEHYDRQERIAAAIKSAVMYPAVLLVMMIAVVLILIVQVLPIFSEVFARLGSQMSPLAIQLMQFGVWLRGVSTVIAIIFCIVFAVILIAWVVPEIRDGIGKAFRNRWGGRGVFGKIASSHFISAMTLALSSGLDVERSIDVAAGIAGGAKSVDEKHDKCMELLRSGKSLSDAIRDAGILSARDSRMLSLGDRSGMVDAAMAEIAHRSEHVVQEEIESLVGRIEPTLVIITSVIVGIILLSVMLPLMGVMTSLG